MATKDTLVDVFNTKLKAFISDLKTVLCEYPHLSPDLAALSSGVNLALSFDKRSPNDIFHKCVTIPYEVYIKDENEDFFLENDYKEQIVGRVNNQTSSDIVEMLKKAWSGLVDENKKAIFAHLKLLVRIDSMIRS